MATYYWVGGNGTWDGSSKTNWATVSGGAGGNGPPTSVDAVIFDASSGTGTCTTAAGSACTTVNLNSATVGLTLGANHTMSGGFTLTAGTLTLGSNTLTALSFTSSNTNTRAIAFGTGNITLTGSAATVVNFGNNAGLTISGTPVMNLNYSGSTGTRTITYGTASGSEARSITMNITAGSDIVTITNGSNIRGLNFTGFTGTYTNGAITTYGDVTFVAGMTLNAGANSINFAATSTQKLTTGGQTLDFPIGMVGSGGGITLQDACTIGSTRTLTQQYGTLNLNGNTLNVGFYGSNYSTTRSITFGSATFNLTGNGATVWNVPTLTGWSYTGTPNVNATYSGATGTRTFNHGNTAGATAANAINILVTAGTDSISAASPLNVNNLNFTGFSGTLLNFITNIYGNLTLSTGMTLTAGGSGTSFIATSGTQQITSNGKTMDFPVTVNAPGATVACQDALTLGSTRTLTFTAGTLQLKNGVTSTVGAFATTGTTQKTLQSTSAGSQATLSDAAGTLNLTYLTVRDIAATGGAKFNALNNCITQGNNSGWYFAPQLGRPLPAFAF